MPGFFEIKFSDISNFYLEHILDKLLHVYIYIYLQFSQSDSSIEVSVRKCFFPSQAGGKRRRQVCKPTSQAGSDMEFSSLQGEFSNTER